jgi:phosphoribosylformylglycinamidine (FGAM) synthase-like amidotransferase family enzyme
VAAGGGRLRVVFVTARDERGDALAGALTEVWPDAEVTWVAPGAPLGPFVADVVVVMAGLADDAVANPRRELVDALRAFAAGGGAVLGLGAGAALLCAAELLPGGVVEGGPASPTTHVRVEGRATPFTWAIPAGRILALGDGAQPGPVYALSDEALEPLEAAGRVVLRYCDHAGGVARTSAAGVAGLCDEAGRVVAVLAPLTTAQGGPLARQILACLRGC